MLHNTISATAKKYRTICHNFIKLCETVAAQYPNFARTCTLYADIAHELALKPDNFWSINRININDDENEDSVAQSEKLTTIRYNCWHTAESFAQIQPKPDIEPMSPILQMAGVIDYRILTGENVRRPPGPENIVTKPATRLSMTSPEFLANLEEMSPDSEYIGDRNYIRLTRACSFLRYQNADASLEMLAMLKRLEEILTHQTQIRDSYRNPSDGRGRNRNPNKTKSARELKRMLELINNSDDGMLPDSDYELLSKMWQNIKYSTSACIGMEQIHEQLFEIYNSQTALRPPPAPSRRRLNTQRAQQRRSQLMTAKGNYNAQELKYIRTSLALSRKRVQAAKTPSPRALSNLHELEECWAAHMAYLVENGLFR